MSKFSELTEEQLAMVTGGAFEKNDADVYQDAYAKANANGGDKNGNYSFGWLAYNGNGGYATATAYNISYVKQSNY